MKKKQHERKDSISDRHPSTKIGFVNRENNNQMRSDIAKENAFDASGN